LSGIGALHEHVAVLVIVDVLPFSTAVDAAVARGAIVEPFPFPDQRGAQAAAEATQGGIM
jgi:2-phosphosulfolactate phosphatase